MASIGKAAHIHTDLGHENLSHHGSHAGHGLSKVAASSKRAQSLADLVIERCKGARELIAEPKMLPQQKTDLCADVLGL